MSVFDDWFDEPGAYVLVDGQFGSTGKGLLAGYIAEQVGEKITHITTNAGPNSGHTAYFGSWDHETYPARFEKIVTQQIPVASMFLQRYGVPVPTLLNAGAIIDSDILRAECKLYGDRATKDIFLHPNAALISKEAKAADQEIVGRVAGTGKGIGPALQQKIGRNREAIASMEYIPMLPPGELQRSWDSFWDWSQDKVFVETAQGFSLGINSAKFYPNVTSRECTVMQALADARIPAQMLQKVVMTLRTFPIRVGNTDTGHSGDCYPDQTELQWDQIGVDPELTTVTKRVRRVFSWSRIQFKEAVAANRPDVLFLNFCNYLNHYELLRLVQQIEDDYYGVMGRDPEILLGHGPYSRDIMRHGHGLGTERRNG